MRYACPACAALLRISDDLPPGKRVRCPKCKEPFTLPARKAGPAETRAATPRRVPPFDDDADEPPISRRVPGKRRFKPKKKQSSMAPFVAVGVGGAVILGGIVLAIVVLPSKHAAPEPAQTPPVVAQSGTPKAVAAPIVPPRSVTPQTPPPFPVVATDLSPELAPPPFVGKGALPDTAPSSPEVGLNVGSLAPDIEGEDIDGKPFKLADYRGKVVVLDFWGNW